MSLYNKIVSKNTFIRYFLVGLLTGIGTISGLKAQPGDALDFTGSNAEAVVVDDASSLDITGDLTISLWAYSSNWAQEGRLFQKDDAYNLYLYTDGTLRFYNYNVSNGVNYSHNLQDNQWHHIAVNYDKSTGDATFYVDGKKQQTLNIKSGGAKLGNSNVDVTIGLDEDSNSFDFEGKMDEIRLWDALRNESDISKLMHQELSPSNYNDLVSYWKFNTGSGSTVTDSKGANGGDLGGNISNGGNANAPNWESPSNAVLNDENNLGDNQTYGSDIAGVWESNTSATSGGLKIQENNTLNTGDDLIFGHNGASGEDKTNNSSYNKGTNYSNSHTSSTTVESRLNREWLIDDDAGSNTVDLIFTTNQAGTSGFSSFDNKQDYVLIEINSSGNDILVQTANTVSTSSNTIKFTGVDISSTYTVGTLDESKSALPVEMVNFKAQKQKEKVALKWATASETNNSHFTIQRKVEGDWERIGKVLGNGTSTQPHDYRFTDERPRQGTNYYRLKQVDFDGSYEFSSIRTVDFESKPGGSEPSLQIVTNPVQGQLKLRFTNPSGQKTSYKLLTMHGKQVQEGVLQPASQQIRTIPMQQLPAGAYLLKVNTVDGTVTRRVIK